MSDPWGTQTEKIAWSCAHCERSTMMEILVRWWIRPKDEAELDFDPFERLVARCTVCELPYILGKVADPDDFFAAPVLEQVFPEPDSQLPSHVPLSVRNAHTEAQNCRRHQSYTAATLMARRGIEAICSEQEADGRTLATKLDDLLQKQVIDQRLLDWSSVIRNLGNEGAHEIDKTASREDAADAIAFLEAIVSYLYTFQQMYENHLARRAQR